MKLCIVAGARPNFMKIAPIVDAIRSHNQSSSQQIDYFIVHTGQHYDKKMSKLFFEDLDIPNPDINLEVGSSSHAIQTAEIMRRFENVCLNENPIHVLVVGDVNSTIACALVASKLSIKVIHVEAGLRSFDRSMPEEINRILTDAISDYLFVTEKSGEENLLKEGVAKEKIFFVGNVMIDSLLKHRKKAEHSNILRSLGLISAESDYSNGSKLGYLSNTKKKLGNCSNAIKPYAVLTLHRPSNVDEKEKFIEIFEAIKEISQHLSVIFPIHPRPLNSIKKYLPEDDFEKVTDEEWKKNNDIRIRCIEPLGYLDFLRLMSSAKLVLTDSGGIQEETTILGIPCVTIRENTERPVTVTNGTNLVAGAKKENIIKVAFDQLNRKRAPCTPPLWDGKAAERILGTILWGR